jgi:hypothetical protein
LGDWSDLSTPCHTLLAGLGMMGEMRIGCVEWCHAYFTNAMRCDLSLSSVGVDSLDRDLAVEDLKNEVLDQRRFGQYKLARLVSDGKKGN